jgi:Flp pilus assembly pilin Flp
MTRPLNRFLRKLVGNDRGATAIEYALLASLVIIPLLVGLNNLADANNGSYAVSTGKLVNAMGR